METLTIIIAISTIVLMMASVIFFPSIVIFFKAHKSITINCYWVICLLGAILMIVCGCVSFDSVIDGITSDAAINPLKILLLFYSMSVMSIILDELGFFKYIASIVANKCKSSQKVLFICFYLCVSVLTVFTSNDIIILTFTPFIIFLCRKLNVNPIPYLISEFIAANTLSMMLIIGNPTNIYLGSFYGITFFEYLKVMALPTIVTAIVVLVLLLLIFKKQLSKSIDIDEVNVEKINDKRSVIITVSHLIVCIILLALSNYLNIQMYLISFILFITLFVYIIINCIITKKYQIIKNTFKRIPYDLCPFVLSMFVLVITLKNQGILLELSTVLSKINNDLYSYGVSSFVCSNFMNNIPMSVMFSEMIVSSNASTTALYATVIGSNLGAYLTPLGALAGIMWLGLLKNEKVEMSFGKFIIYTGPISLIAMCVSLLLLGVVL